MTLLSLYRGVVSPFHCEGCNGYHLTAHKRWSCNYVNWLLRSIREDMVKHQKEFIEVLKRDLVSYKEDEK